MMTVLSPPHRLASQVGWDMSHPLAPRYLDVPRGTSRMRRIGGPAACSPVFAGVVRWFKSPSGHTFEYLESPNLLACSHPMPRRDDLPTFAFPILARSPRSLLQTPTPNTQRRARLRSKCSDEAADPVPDAS